MNFDVKNVGDTLYTSVVRYLGDTANPTYEDVSVEDVDLLKYKEEMGYNRDLNNYDYMLVGFSHLLSYMYDNKVYEEGDVVIEYKNELLFKWIEEGLSKTGKKYLPHFNHIMRNLHEILNELGDNELELLKSVKNNAKHFLTKTELKNRGYETVAQSGVKLSKNSRLGYKKPAKQSTNSRKVSRANRESIGKKVVDISKFNKYGS